MKILQPLLNKITKNAYPEPFNLNLPSFEIDNDTFNNSMMDSFREKLITSVNSNKYGNKDLLQASFDDFKLSLDKKEAGITLSSRDYQLINFWENIMPEKVILDKNLHPLELKRATINEAISNRLNDTLMDITFNEFVALNNPESKTDLKNSENKFIASMFILKNDYPMAYNSCIPTLQMTDKFKELEPQFKKPSMDIVQEIINYNEITAKALFPLHVEKLKSEKGEKLKI